MADSGFTKIAKKVLGVQKGDVGMGARIVRVLEQKKNQKVTVDSGHPEGSTGTEGDIQLRDIANEGVFLYTKFKGNWLRQRMDDEGSVSSLLGEIIQSSTGSGDVLVYDSNKQKYVNRQLYGDITINKKGKVTIVDNALTYDKIKGMRLIEENFNDSIIFGDAIKDGNICINHLRESQSSANDKVFSSCKIVALTGAALNAGGAYATAIIDLTGNPGEGVAATGSISFNIVEGNSGVPSSGSSLEIDDGEDKREFVFYKSEDEFIGELGKVGVQLQETLNGTMQSLKNAINANTLINCSDPTPGTEAVSLTHTIFGAEGNITIKQSSDEFTLVGMTGGSNGEYFTLPEGADTFESKINFRPTTSADNIRMRANREVAEASKYVAKGADTNATAAAVTSAFSSSDRFTVTNSSGEITIVRKSPGASGNGTVVDGGSNITVTQSFTGGADANAKYFCLYHPKKNLSISPEYSENYVKVFVTFNIDKKQIGAGYTSPDFEYKHINIDTLTNSSTAQNVSDKIVEVLGNYTYKGEKMFNVTNSSSTTVSISAVKSGRVPSPEAGTSGMTISDVTNGGEGLELDGNFTMSTTNSGDFDVYSANNILIDAVGDIVLDAAGQDISFGVMGTNYLTWNVTSGLTFLYAADASKTATLSMGTGGLFTISAPSVGGGDILLDAKMAIKLDAEGGDIFYQKNSVSFGSVDMDTASTLKFNAVEDYDLVFNTSGDGRVEFSSEDRIDFAPGTDSTFSTNVMVKEMSAANNDRASYGQLWVKDSTANELCFTDDAGTDIVGVGKYHYETKFIGYYGNNAYAWLPMTGYIIEGSNATSRNEYQSFIAPYNGTLVSYQARSEIGQGGSNHSLRVNEASDGTEIPGTLIYRKDYDPGSGIGIADDTVIDWDFSSPSVGSDPITFTKGRLYMFYVAFAAASFDTNITLVFKWDITS